jgi:hypothetical protein
MLPRYNLLRSRRWPGQKLHVHATIRTAEQTLRRGEREKQAPGSLTCAGDRGRRRRRPLTCAEGGQLEGGDHLGVEVEGGSCVVLLWLCGAVLMAVPLHAGRHMQPPAAMQRLYFS